MPHLRNNTISEKDLLFTTILTLSDSVYDILSVKKLTLFEECSVIFGSLQPVTIRDRK